MLIYKILTAEDWAALQEHEEITGAPVDVADGFIHFSTADQVRETAAKHFAGQTGLMLFAFDSEALGETLKWEPSRGGALFPHLYGPLKMDDLVWGTELPLGPDGHEFPEDLDPQ